MRRDCPQRPAATGLCSGFGAETRGRKSGRTHQGGAALGAAHRQATALSPGGLGRGLACATVPRRGVTRRMVIRLPIVRYRLYRSRCPDIALSLLWVDVALHGSRRYDARRIARPWRGTRSGRHRQGTGRAPPGRRPTFQNVQRPVTFRSNKITQTQYRGSVLRSKTLCGHKIHHHHHMCTIHKYSQTSKLGLGFQRLGPHGKESRIQVTKVSIPALAFKLLIDLAGQDSCAHTLRLKALVITKQA